MGTAVTHAPATEVRAKDPEPRHGPGTPRAPPA